ncbi:MAG: O-methyltransferase, partial [Cryomorphaceae bacterium]|nr:O-methyltransferase [Cryomorphaceae bacterium]
MEFLPPHIDAYAGEFTAPHSETLAALERETWQEVLMPRMLSGHQQGRFLSLISHLLRPARVLEIGTYTGYSALCMAEGLAEGGIIHTIDINAELRPRIERFMEKAGFADRIQLHIGNALDIVPSLDGPWDLVFIDADKENYSAYFDLVVDRVRPGGVIIADNVLWSGKVAEPEHQ